MKCQRCNGNRVANISAKCSDCCSVCINKYNESGYVPKDMGVGGDDYVKISWCLDCGQIQGKWPLKQCEAEKFNPKACKMCDWDDFDEIGECSNCGHHKEMWCPKYENRTQFRKVGNGLARCNVNGYNCVVSFVQLKEFNEEE